MKLIIHRGNQIGGCIAEIYTDTSRVFIDMGQNLPGHAEKTTFKQDQNMVNGFFNANKREHEAVVYTHAHEDHVGLFRLVPENIPQYISEGGQKILLGKQNLLFKNHLHDVKKVLSMKLEWLKYLNRLKYNRQSIARINRFHTWKRTEVGEEPVSLQIGNIRLTPFYCSHSIYDAYMFLIEADGKRIWYTGDYRIHGYVGKDLFERLSTYAKDIDILVTEGTMLGRTDECIQEEEISKQMTEVMRKYKYVFVLASSTDMERQASIQNAAYNAGKDLMVGSDFMASMMNIFTKCEGKKNNKLFYFNYKMYYTASFPSMKENGFILDLGASQIEVAKELLPKLDAQKTILIYSSWDGYYKLPEQVEINPKYKEFRELFTNVVDIHTSGHADCQTIEKVITIVNPKEAIIGIHKEPDTSLKSLNLPKELMEKIQEL